LIHAEDIAEGQRVEFGVHTVSREEILSFGRAWAPLPLHADERAAASGPFGGLIANGIHTMGIYQRLAVAALWRRTAVIAGRTLREIELLRPVRPGTTLTGHLELREIRPRPNGDAMVAAHAELREAPSGPVVFRLVVDVLVSGRRREVPPPRAGN
jgi:acyl dehydratase